MGVHVDAIIGQSGSVVYVENGQSKVAMNEGVVTSE
jgi:hypothetical protein